MSTRVGVLINGIRKMVIQHLSWWYGILKRHTSEVTALTATFKVKLSNILSNTQQKLGTIVAAISHINPLDALIRIVKDAGARSSSVLNKMLRILRQSNLPFRVIGYCVASLLVIFNPAIRGIATMLIMSDLINKRLTELFLGEKEITVDNKSNTVIIDTTGISQQTNFGRTLKQMFSSLGIRRKKSYANNCAESLKRRRRTTPYFRYVSMIAAVVALYKWRNEVLSLIQRAYRYFVNLNRFKTWEQSNWVLKLHRLITNFDVFFDCANIDEFIKVTDRNVTALKQYHKMEVDGNNLINEIIVTTGLYNFMDKPQTNWLLNIMATLMCTVNLREGLLNPEATVAMWERSLLLDIPRVIIDEKMAESVKQLYFWHRHKILPCVIQYVLHYNATKAHVDVASNRRQLHIGQREVNFNKK